MLSKEEISEAEHGSTKKCIYDTRVPYLTVTVILKCQSAKARVSYTPFKKQLRSYNCNIIYNSTRSYNNTSYRKYTPITIPNISSIDTYRPVFYCKHEF